MVSIRCFERGAMYVLLMYLKQKLSSLPIVHISLLTWKNGRNNFYDHFNFFFNDFITNITQWICRWNPFLRSIPQNVCNTRLENNLSPKVMKTFQGHHWYDSDTSISSETWKNGLISSATCKNGLSWKMCFAFPEMLKKTT